MVSEPGPVSGRSPLRAGRDPEQLSRELDSHHKTKIVEAIAKVCDLRA